MNSTDIILIVSGEQFPCHRYILQQKSPYFNAMFNSEMLEKSAKQVEIHDVEPTIFKILLDFSYGRDINISNENVVSLLKASNIFQFDYVQQKCCKYLVDGLDVTNCATIWELANFLNISSLYCDAKTFIITEFSNVIKEQDFIQLSLKLLLELLSHDMLNCVYEMEVFHAILCWIKPKYKEMSNLVKLLSCIRYQSLNQEDMEIIKNHPLIQETLEAKKFLNLITDIINKTSSAIENEESESLSILCEKPIVYEWLYEMAQFSANNERRKSIFLPLLVGQYYCSVTNDCRSNDNPIENVFINQKTAQKASLLLQYTENTFKEMSHPHCLEKKTFMASRHFYNQLPVFGYVACSVESNLYLLGGEYKIGSGYWNKTVWKCDLKTLQWVNVGSMLNERRHCLILAHEEMIYLIGGYGKFRKKLTSVESYNTETGEWQERDPIPNPIHSSAVVSYEKNIYIFSTPIYYYEPSKDKWTEVLLWKDIGFSAAFVFKNHIYAVTTQDSAVMLCLTLPEFKFNTEFVFPLSINCGCLIKNMFYGFSERQVIIYDMMKKIYEVQNLNGDFYSEMCCVIPNYKDI